MVTSIEQSDAFGAILALQGEDYRSQNRPERPFGRCRSVGFGRGGAAPSKSLTGMAWHEAHAAVKSARTQVASKMEAVRDRAILDSRRSHETMKAHMHDIAQGARRSITDASAQSTALFREIAGQGPEKTLTRGFAVVQDAERTLITRLDQTHPGQSLEIQFRDGFVTSLVTSQ